MSTRKTGIGLTAFVNAVLVIAIAALYVITSQGEEKTVAAVGAPIYKGNVGDAVSLQWIMCYNAAATDSILDTLKERNIRCTFIVSGEWAKENPTALLRMVNDGHELGTMGTNPRTDGNLSFLTRDILTASGIIEGIVGIQPSLYYSGEKNAARSSMVAKKLGLSHIQATLDLLCSNGTVDDIIRRADSVTGGSIVLMQPTRQAAEALDMLIDRLSADGFRITTTGEIIGPSAR